MLLRFPTTPLPLDRLEEMRSEAEGLDPATDPEDLIFGVQEMISLCYTEIIRLRDQVTSLGGDPDMTNPILRKVK